MTRSGAPRQLGPADDFTALHARLIQAFAMMNGRIDPPSSLTRMSAETPRADAAQNETWEIDDSG